MKLVPLLLTVLFSVSSLGDYIDLGVTHETGPDGFSYFCYKPVPSSIPKKCLRVISSEGFAIKTGGSQSYPRVTKLEVKEVSVGSQGQALTPADVKIDSNVNNFEVTLIWEGLAPGMMLDLDLNGGLQVVGNVKRTPENKKTPFSVEIINFFDTQLSDYQQRVQLIGESQTHMVEFKTNAWLIEALKPALEDYFKQKADKLSASLKINQP